MKKSKKRPSLTYLFLIALIMALAVYGYQYMQEQNSSDMVQIDLEDYQQEQVKRGTITTGIEENGIVVLGTASQIFSLSAASESGTGASALVSGISGNSNSNNRSSSGGTNGNSMQQASVSSDSSMELEVEEIYATTGQMVKEGDQILKITPSSISRYRNSLESAIASAKLNVQAEAINLESKRAESDYNYQINLAQGEIAEENYQATLKTLTDAITKAEEEIAEKQEEIDMYQEYVNAGYGYEEELEEAEKSMETLQANLLIQKNNQTTGSIEAKQTYEAAMTNYKYADQLYAIDNDGMEDALNEAKATLLEAEAALEEFEAKIGEGYLLAEQEGLITEISYAQGDILSNNNTIVSYVDESDVTISVYVSQQDITGISVDDVVTIWLDAYPDQEFAGKVIGISTIAAAGSATVNYEVTVAFTEHVDKLYSGMTGDVFFAGKTVSDTLYIPNRAVAMEGAKSMVKVLDQKGNVTDVEVKTGFSDGTVVAVESGLDEGQVVLIRR